MNYAALPFYESKATPEEKQQERICLRKQIELILDQERIKVPMQHVRIRCGCGKLINWQYMFRCLYCGVWFCKTCAEEHYGMRVPESFVGVQRES